MFTVYIKFWNKIHLRILFFFFQILGREIDLMFCDKLTKK